MLRTAEDRSASVIAAAALAASAAARFSSPHHFSFDRGAAMSCWCRATTPRANTVSRLRPRTRRHARVRRHLRDGAASVARSNGAVSTTSPRRLAGGYDQDASLTVRCQRRQQSVSCFAMRAHQLALTQQISSGGSSPSASRGTAACSTS